MIRYFAFLVVFFLGTTILFSQEAVAKDLLKRAKGNYNRIHSEPENTFQEAFKIIEEAKRLNTQEPELIAILTQCLYQWNKNDYKNAMALANHLFQKAEIYDSSSYKALAKLFLFDIYLSNDLPEKAIRELNQSLAIIKKNQKRDSLVTAITSNIYIGYSNYYFSLQEYDKVPQYIRLSILENEKFHDEGYKQKLQSVNYANLGLAYEKLNSDSAKYYAELSLAKYPGEPDVKFLNLLNLGKIAVKAKHNETALAYFQEAEKISGIRNHFNMEQLYDEMIKIYTELGNYDQIKIYKSKRDSLRLVIFQNQNKALHKMVNEKRPTDGSNRKAYLFITICVVMSAVILIIIRKNRILAHQDKISQEYLDNSYQVQNGEDFSLLLEMVKNNDPAFIPYFNELYPDFVNKLLKINPKVSSPDIEFCALLKLKIPTHNIAQYKNITIKSVRNKKYSIRKKMNIPQNVDIYNWFGQI